MNVTRAPITFEIRRKLIHLVPLVIPLVSTFDLLQKGPLLIIVAVSTLVALWLDFARRRSGPVKTFFFRIFGSFLRKDETDTAVASTYYFTGMFLSIALFPRPIAEASMYILIFGDTMAAIVGMSLGRVKIWGKSLEGSIAFFLSSCIILSFLGRVEFVVWLPGAFVATIVELLPIPFSDNLSIPISSGLCMYLISNFI
ncbi:MAG: diacylglycerol/polyprenol kinase family protein [Candidatus Glassbacteria bacterium]